MSTTQAQAPRATFGTVGEGAEFQVPPEGTYEIELQDVLDDGLSPKYGTPRFKWICQFVKVITIDGIDPGTPEDELDEDELILLKDAHEAIGQDKWHWTSQTISISKRGKSNALIMLEAFLGRELEKGERPSLDDVIGKRCRATLMHNVVGDKTYGNFTSFKPLPRRAARSKPAPSPAPAPVADDEWDEDDE